MTRVSSVGSALDIWQLLDSDPSITPTTLEYTAAISACERAGEPARGLSLYAAMQANGVPPDATLEVVDSFLDGGVRLTLREWMREKIETLVERTLATLFFSSGAALVAPTLALAQLRRRALRLFGEGAA